MDEQGDMKAMGSSALKYRRLGLIATATLLSLLAAFGTANTALAGDPVAVPVKRMEVAFARGITSGPDGNVWFVGATLRDDMQHLYRASPTGALSRVPLPGLGHKSRITGIAAGPDGRIWISAAKAKFGKRSTIYRVRPSGAVSAFPLPNNTRAYALTPAPDGRVWFSDVSKRVVKSIGVDRSVRKVWSGKSYITSMVQGGDGSMWLQSSLGAIRIARDGSRRTFETSLQPVTDIARDGAGFVWLTGTKGLSRLSPSGGQTQVLLEFPTKGSGVDRVSLGLFARADGLLGFIAGWQAQSLIDVYIAIPSIGFVRDGAVIETEPDVGVDAEGGTTWTETIEHWELGTKMVATGPDGLVWASTDQTRNSTGLSVFAVSPALPVLDSAPEIKSTRKLKRRMLVTLACSGQPGRLCSGSVVLRSRSGARIGEASYATAPGDLNRVEIAVSPKVRGELTASLLDPAGLPVPFR